jgi:hypothetical protein
MGGKPRFPRLMPIPSPPLIPMHQLGLPCPHQANVACVLSRNPWISPSAPKVDCCVIPAPCSWLFHPTHHCARPSRNLIPARCWIGQPLVLAETVSETVLAEQGCAVWGLRKNEFLPTAALNCRLIPERCALQLMADFNSRALCPAVGCRLIPERCALQLMADFNSRALCPAAGGAPSEF